MVRYRLRKIRNAATHHEAAGTLRRCGFFREGQRVEAAGLANGYAYGNGSDMVTLVLVPAHFKGMSSRTWRISVTWGRFVYKRDSLYFQKRGPAK